MSPHNLEPEASKTGIMGNYDKYKGEKVRFVKGDYVGCDVWLNTKKEKKGVKTGRVHVIVDTDEEGEQKKCVMRSSIRRFNEKAKTYEEAILELQHFLSTDVSYVSFEIVRCLTKSH